MALKSHFRWVIGFKKKKSTVQSWLAWFKVSVIAGVVLQMG